jgi:carbon-monoxide dehydrogenase small subunit
MAVHRLSFDLNGARVEREVPSERLLIDLLRDELGLTGTKEGCGVGVCGTCTVLLDGAPMSACLLFAVFVDGRAVTTIEGLAEGERLTPLQEAFASEGGFQCGICTPGQIVMATALLAERPHPSDEEITEWMTGSLCRCTGYEGIRKSIRKAAG